MANTIQPGDDILLTWEGSDDRRMAKVVALDNGAARLEGGGFIRDDLPKRNAKGMWTYEYGQSGG